MKNWEKIIIIISFLVIIYFLYKSSSHTSYVVSRLDNRKYLVQNLKNKEEATDILSIIHQRIAILRNYLKNHIDDYPEYKPYIRQFYNKTQHVVLRENSVNGKYTSFTVNKGEQIFLCLRSKKNGRIHDTNLIMYVTLHELAHTACPDYNHTKLFKKIFIFLLEIAIILGIYDKANYQDFPEEYCGLVIDEYLLRY